MYFRGSRIAIALLHDVNRATLICTNSVSSDIEDWFCVRCDSFSHRLTYWRKIGWNTSDTDALPVKDVNLRCVNYAKYVAQLWTVPPERALIQLTSYVHVQPRLRRTSTTSPKNRENRVLLKYLRFSKTPLIIQTYTITRRLSSHGESDIFATNKTISSSVLDTKSRKK